MSNKTLKTLTDQWPKFDFSRYHLPLIRSSGQLKVDNSKSGGAMVLLKGIEVQVDGKWFDAHLSFPPDNTGLGTFTEGHLKIEEGHLLNQYFFSCDENETWEVQKLANSPTVKTKNPGDWNKLGQPLWLSIEKMVIFLAYL